MAGGAARSRRSSIPDIRAYLEAENDYTESLLGHTGALQKTLVAEMRGRIKEDDSSVPSPDGPFAYLRKFREGGQHELIGRMPRDGGEAADPARRRRAGRRPRLFQVRRRAAFAGPPAARPGAPTCKGSEYFTIRVRDWATGSDLRRHRRGDRRRRGLERGLARASSTSSSTTTTARCRSAAIGSARRRPTTSLVYEEKDSGWFTHIA